MCVQQQRIHEFIMDCILNEVKFQVLSNLSITTRSITVRNNFGVVIHVHMSFGSRDRQTVTGHFIKLLHNVRLLLSVSKSRAK